MLEALIAFGTLLSGYIFSIIFKPSCWRAVREADQRLYFRAAFYGLFLLFCAIQLFVIDLGRLAPWGLSELAGQFHGVLKLLLPPEMVKEPRLGGVVTILLLTFSLSFLMSHGLNVVLHIADAALEDTAYADWLLRSALRDDDQDLLLLDAGRRGIPVSVTMANNKVYIGMVLRTPDPGDVRVTLKLLTLKSGYRTEHGKLALTTDYSRIYQTIVDQGSGRG